MKKIILSLGIVALTALNAHSQDNTAAPETKTSLAEISFENDVHDYGTIKQGANGVCEFKFKNTGKEPLIISNAKGSCGCTVPDWSKEPIKPNESGIIKVSYDTKRTGPINKSVTVTSNAKTAPTKILKITGIVEAVPVEETFPMKQPPAGAPVEK